MEDTSFFNAVYELVKRIPAGKVMTYGQISSLLDERCSARYVGYAMASAPQKRGLACHRVVNRLGEMAPGSIFGGPEEQRDLLEEEGVIFLENGRIDLRLCLWQPEEEES